MLRTGCVSAQYTEGQPEAADAESIVDYHNRRHRLRSSPRGGKGQRRAMPGSSRLREMA
jgi:hypothetical protein